MFLFPPRHHGVLGLNARNLLYIGAFNPERAMAFADSKLKTKAYLEARGIPVPKLYAKVESREELRRFSFDGLPRSCVLKPNFGYGGQGIRVFIDRRDGAFVEIGGRTVSDDDLFAHIEDILDAKFSLNHTSDTAFFEQRLRPHECFSVLNPQGLPDLRIIVFNLVPVMAMLRVPTVESRGKANVHLGGIGLGIDMSRGVTTYAAQYNRRISVLPTGQSPAGMPIPSWEQLLLVASRVQQITNIGFLAVDLVLDAEAGPTLLEVNARAGLMVQVANLAPLRSRLERVRGLRVSSPEKGVRLARDLFGETVGMAGGTGGASLRKPVLGTRETITVLGGKQPVRAVAVVRPDHDRTIVDPSFVEELRSLDALEDVEEGTYRVKLLIAGTKLKTVVTAHPVREHGARISLGRRDLTSFLLDPGKREAAGATIPATSQDLRRVDRQLADIDRKVQLLRCLRPVNVEEERRRALADPAYEPVLQYRPLPFDPHDIVDRLRYLRADGSPLGVLLERKRAELLQKVALLEARGDADAFTVSSVNLYGSPLPALTRQARAEGQATGTVESVRERETVSSEVAQERFVTILQSYGLYEWQVCIVPGLITDCAVGRKAIVIRQGACFSEERLTALIAHEVETHVLIAENGARQPHEVFARGCAGYLDTQEGLAIWNQNRVLPPRHEKRSWPAQGVLAVHAALQQGFAGVRRVLRGFGVPERRAVQLCFKVKRGLTRTSESGAFTRELTYFRGWQMVQDFAREGGDLRRLYVGRIALIDLSLVEQVKGLLPPVFLPAYLRTSPEAATA